jgi:hypothetical protein
MRARIVTANGTGRATVAVIVIAIPGAKRHAKAGRAKVEHAKDPANSAATAGRAGTIATIAKMVEGRIVARHVAPTVRAPTGRATMAHAPTVRVPTGRATMPVAAKVARSGLMGPHAARAATVPRHRVRANLSSEPTVVSAVRSAVAAAAGAGAGDAARAARAAATDS